MKKNKLRRKTYFVLLCVIPLLLSCMTGYVPNASTTAFYEKPGDFSVSAYTGSNGYDGQLSVAIADEIFLATGASFLSQDSSIGENRDYARHSYYEGGIGYYVAPNNKWRISFLGGVGKGKIHFISGYDFYDESDESKGNYLKYYLQNNMGFTTKVVDLGLNIRYNFVQFLDYSSLGTDYGSISSQFLEPAFFVRVGWKNIRYQLQYSIIYNFTRNCPFSYDPIRISAGISFSINTFRKKSDNKE